jgi:O-acetyl-ADP-ribose deacetylase (regulator of RNase III)
MLNYVIGDLLKSDCDVIAHQCNCFMAFGSGIAGQIRQQLPGAYKSFIKDDRSPETKLGSYCAATTDVGSFLAVYNLYGQFTYGTNKVQTIYPALSKSLTGMMKDLDDNDILKTVKIGIPYRIGCGLAGGDWEIVEEMLHDVSDRYQRDIHIYILETIYYTN